MLSPGIDVVSWETSPLFAGADLRCGGRSLVAADALAHRRNSYIRVPPPFDGFSRILVGNSSQDLQLGGD